MAIRTLHAELSRWLDRWTDGYFIRTHHLKWTSVCASKDKQMVRYRLVKVLTRKPVSVAGVMAGLVIIALTSTANATPLPFLDDFEGDGEVSKTPASSLRNWDIINNVDLLTEDYIPPRCRLSGACIDLVGTTGAKTGGLISKITYPSGAYEIGFFLYGSNRGTVSRIQVNLGGQSIYANKNLPPDFEEFVVVRVRGSGKLRFIGGGGVSNIGPLLDNVVIIPLSSR